MMGQLLADCGRDFCTGREPLGYKDVRLRFVYTRVVN